MIIFPCKLLNNCKFFPLGDYIVLSLGLELILFLRNFTNDIKKPIDFFFFLQYTKQREGRSWTRAGAAVLHSGGIRTSIQNGSKFQSCV